jgi:hypothetical protein
MTVYEWLGAVALLTIAASGLVIAIDSALDARRVRRYTPPPLLVDPPAYPDCLGCRLASSAGGGLVARHQRRDHPEGVRS